MMVNVFDVWNRNRIRPVYWDLNFPLDVHWIRPVYGIRHWFFHLIRHWLFHGDRASPDYGNCYGMWHCYVYGIRLRYSYGNRLRYTHGYRLRYCDPHCSYYWYSDVFRDFYCLSQSYQVFWSYVMTCFVVMIVTWIVLLLLLYFVFVVFGSCEVFRLYDDR